MTDVHSPETRSYNMSRIHGKDTKPEELVRKYLFARGFRYRKNDRKLPGKPDIVLPKYKTVVFINGCFWHAHEGCRYFVWPKSNVEFWHNKINGNVVRDRSNYNKLLSMGWNVLVIWQCELRKDVFTGTMDSLVHAIMSNYEKTDDINNADPE